MPRNCGLELQMPIQQWICGYHVCDQSFGFLNDSASSLHQIIRTIKYFDRKTITGDSIQLWRRSYFSQFTDLLKKLLSTFFKAYKKKTLPFKGQLSFNAKHSSGVGPDLCSLVILAVSLPWY